jgi:hypothetical protein
MLVRSCPDARDGRACEASRFRRIVEYSSMRIAGLLTADAPRSKGSHTPDGAPMTRLLRTSDQS